MAKEKSPTKRRGRPPKSPEEVKRVPLSLRTTPEFRKKFEDAAAKSGRSIAQEVEQRLERSFFFEETLSMSGSDPTTSKLVRDLLDAKRLVEMHSENDVWEDYEAWVSWRSAIFALMETYKPTEGKSFKDRQNKLEQERNEWAKQRGGLFGIPSKPNEDLPQPETPPLEQAAIIGRAIANVMQENKLKELNTVIGDLKHKGMVNALMGTAPANTKKMDETDG